MGLWCKNQTFQKKNATFEALSFVHRFPWSLIFFRSIAESWLLKAVSYVPQIAATAVAQLMPTHCHTMAGIFWMEVTSMARYDLLVGSLNEGRCIDGHLDRNFSIIDNEVLRGTRLFSSSFSHSPASATSTGLRLLNQLFNLLNYSPRNV